MAELRSGRLPAPDDIVVQTAGGRRIAWSRLLADARLLGRSLQGAGPIANLCHDRYAFATTLIGGALAQRAILLPSDRSPANLRALGEAYPGTLAISDDAGELALSSREGMDVREFAIAGSVAASGDCDLGEIGRTTVVMFTSGSTGRPEPCARPLEFFVTGARGNAAGVQEGLSGRASIVATVPPYHMFGFELSIAQPLFVGGCVHSGRPFYPADIARALEAVSAPRILVSTPAHLRVLQESRVALPPVERVFSATAPLPPTLARDLEAAFGGEVREIYGTTETGCIGWRRTASETNFRPARGMNLETDGDASRVSAPHIAPPFVLGDRLELKEGGSFRVAGRSNDIVNVAGKRMSLSGLNAILAGLPGVIDGAFLAPADDADGPVKRLTAFAVAPSLTGPGLRDLLRNRLDAAFLPRKVVFVDALPRNAAGKLPEAGFRRFALDRLAETIESERSVVFAGDEPYFEGHFPDGPVVPGAVLLDEAWELLDEGLGGYAGEAEILSAKFPGSAIPDEPCHFRLSASGAGRVRVECRQADRTVMRATVAAMSGTRDE